MFSRIVDSISSWWAVIIFFIIFINGLTIAQDVSWGNNFKTYNAIGTASAVAIAFLALIAYMQYSHSRFKTTRYKKWISSLDKNYKQAALLIFFGGKGSSPESVMKGFARHTLDIDNEHMMFREFGRGGKVGKEDILELQKFISEFQSAFSHVEEIVILVKGAGPAFAVCGDMLGNWKPMKIYHYQGKYELWYASEKHAPKPIDTVNDNQIA